MGLHSKRDDFYSETATFQSYTQTQSRTITVETERVQSEALWTVTAEASH